LDHLEVRAGGTLIGYAQRDGSTAEIAATDVAVIERLITDLVERGAISIWSHGLHSPLEAALAQAGFTATRTLHQLQRHLAPESVTVPEPRDAISVRTFVVGQDEDALLKVNAAAFANHPEQGAWTHADLDARERETWFDPAGIFLAERAPGAAGAGEVLGFHWTKLHGDGSGEVYVICVDPSAQGLGLGALLLAYGLRHLADRGCPSVRLYVDDDNAGARALYARTGFVEFDRDVQWTRGQ